MIQKNPLHHDRGFFTVTFLTAFSMTNSLPVILSETKEPYILLS